MIIQFYPCHNCPLFHRNNICGTAEIMLLYVKLFHFHRTSCTFAYFIYYLYIIYVK